MNQNQEPELTMNENTTDANETVASAEKNTQSEETQATLSSKNQNLTKDEILEQLKELASKKNVPTRGEVDALKQAYYKHRIVEVEAEKAAFLGAENGENDFVATPDPKEDVLKVYLNDIKEKRASMIAAEEHLREDNYKRKLKIIDALQVLTESTDDFNKLYKDFKDLQVQWNDIKIIPASKEKDLWKSYQHYTEIFYDLIKINHEFRDYDFKKNLELKTSICDSVEKLVDDSDVVSAFHQLQNFHQQWRESGPVSKELRDEIWDRFKAASTTINKKYQLHFESLKEKEDENLDRKTAICTTLRAIDFSVLNSMRDWDEKSKEVIELQALWKTIGFVPKKVNTQIFEEFRALCDLFFEKKSEFFKGVKNEMEINLEKKRVLCERVKVLKDSTDWKKTADELIVIQKEWKKIGPVSRKYSDEVWKEFVTACDYFFEQKKKNTSSHKEEEETNLKAKQEIVEQIKNVDQSLEASLAIAQVRELADQWHAIGFVPFKEKDKAYKELHEAIDAHYDRLKVDKSERRLDTFKSNLSDMSKQGGGDAKKKLLKERDRLVHTYNKLKADLHTYENNMSFLSISSKGANSLLKNVNHKMDDLKAEMLLIEQKIETIDESLAVVE